MTTIDEEIVKQAKDKGINISEAAEFGLRKTLMNEVIKEDALFPVELAETDPDNYWIASDGTCRKRGKPQYFINESGRVTETHKDNYLYWLKYYGKNARKGDEAQKDEDDGIMASFSEESDE